MNLRKGYWIFLSLRKSSLRNQYLLILLTNIMNYFLSSYDYHRILGHFNFERRSKYRDIAK